MTPNTPNTPNTPDILGIHHVTAIATDPRRNLDFYSEVLGLRLVKKTVNFDDPGTYHLYYGDESGSPGTILTFFPWPMARRGSRGTGQATTTAYSVPEGSLGFWQERLSGLGIVTEPPRQRFEEELVTLLDPDGLKLELVAHAGAAERQPWAGGPVPERHALRGFHSVALTVRSAEASLALLTDGMGFGLADEGRDRIRLEIGDPVAAGTRVDLLPRPAEPAGHVAAGTVHHVAWRVAGGAEQEAWRERIAARGLHVTQVLDRTYFRSIYFREPGGVLYEIATDPPGFTLDESRDELGSSLRLPAWLEPHRQRIEARLPPLGAAAVAGSETA